MNVSISVHYIRTMYVTWRSSNDLVLPRLSSAEEENPESWQPFRDPDGMMVAAERQLAVEDWYIQRLATSLSWIYLPPRINGAIS